MPENTSTDVRSEWKTARFWLAIGVTVTSIISVATLTGLIIQHSTDKSDTGTRVLGSILPLLGTWVGTVLAYYFSKENFEAATKSVTELAKQISPQERLRSTAVTQVMILRKDMFFKTGPTSQLKLSEVLKELEDAKKGSRIPILDSSGEALWIFHRSLIDRFLVVQARDGKTASEIALLSFDDILKDADLKRLASAYGIVKLDSNLSDAADAMNRIADCQDVFVTKTGSKQEDVLGWITNVVVQDNAKV